MIRKLALTAAALVLISNTACADQGADHGDHDHGHDHSHDGVVFTAEDAWVRIPAPGRDVTAAYVSLSYHDGEAVLIGAQSSEAEAIELHTMAMEGDRMRMRRVESFTVPEGDTLELAPGGDHLMIFGLAPDALADGELVVTLEFESGETMDLSLEALQMAPEMSQHQH